MVKKKVKKKATKKKTKKSSVHKKRKAVAKQVKEVQEIRKKIKSLHTVITAAVVLLVFAFILLLTQPVSQGKVAAVVNGDEITVDEIDQMYNQIPEQYRSLITEEQVLNQLIDETLLVQKARELGLGVSQDEVQSAISDAISSTGMSQAQYDAYLVEIGLTREDMYEYYEKQIILYQKLPKQVVGEIVITEEEIDKYLEESPLANHTLDMRGVVRGFLEAQQEKVLFMQYLADVKESAEIEIFYGSESVTGQAVNEKCSAKYVEEEVIFYSEDWCPSCNKIKPLLEDYNVAYVSSDSPVMKNCYSNKIEEGMPQLICTNNWKRLTGDVTSEEVKEFISKC